MSYALRNVLGLEIVASATADAVELGGARLSNEEAYRALLGESWRDELSRRGWSAAHPAERWGIEQREWLCAPGAPRKHASVVELAAQAAQRALDAAEWERASVDVLVCATSTPLRISSSLAGVVAKSAQLGAACFDLRAGGAGGLQALVVAAQQLASGAKRALVVAAETCSPFLDRGELVTSMLLGDGAAALALERREGSRGGLVAACMGSARSEGRALTIPGELPPTLAALERGEFAFQRPDAAYEASVARARALAANELLREIEDAPRAKRWCCPYAVTRRQADEAARELRCETERTLTSLSTHAATGAAGALLALDRLLHSGRAGRGDEVSSVAVGGGLHWAALSWRL